MGFSKTIGRIIRGFFTFPTTLYVNFKTLPFSQAVHLPIVIMSKTRLHSLKQMNIMIVGTISLVTKLFIKENCIIGGGPAKSLKENIYWNHEKEECSFE